MTGGDGSRAGHPRRDLAAILVAGAAGAGVVLLVTRQQLARVVVDAPRPLPDSVTAVSAQDVRPAIAALALAALASLAAVLATRGLLRRLTGVLTVALGAGVAATALGPVTTAAVLAAAGRAGASPATGSGAGTAAGSVTAGNGGSTAPGGLTGFPVHVVLTGTGWRVVMIAGAVLIVAAGLAVVMLARRLPVMSGRYESRSLPAAPGQRDRPAREDDPPQPAQATSMWESLSAGADPTTGPD
ncbi:MAG TPA: Trp biosynthesis-associated membrane protein [Streptosporangiaceae bacterium]|nr:Trp biosynthesis-associated membrane protein [Streptosporangiaceae bacterium]